MPIITVSRGSMSGGQALAQCLAVALGAPCVGREIVVGAAATLGVSEQVLAAKLEESPGLWQRLTMERRLYVTAVQAALAEYAVGGNLVYHGLAGHLLLRGIPALFRVRLIAPMEARVRAMVEREGGSAEEAERVIRQRDAERHRWTEAMYGVDLSDPRLYDLVINLESMTIPSACAAVIAAAERPEYTVTAEVRAQLVDFLLTTRVRLALASHPGSRGLDLDVATARGVVTIRGAVPRVEMLAHTSSRWRRELTEIARSVKGVGHVSLELEDFDAYH